MACTGRYAEAWQFAAFWCVGSIISGADNGGGAGLAFLTDTSVDFLTAGAQAGVGMVLYNTTTNLSGVVTAATINTLTATGVTWSNGNAYRIVLINAIERSTIEHYLNITAGDLHAVMAQSGMCDCVLASWAANFLAKLNIIDTAAFYNCTCGAPRMTDDTRKSYLAWASTQLEAIRTGKLELCEGATGVDFPALGWAEQGLTDFAAAEIIFNASVRYG